MHHDHLLGTRRMLHSGSNIIRQRSHNDSSVVQKFIVHISKPFGCFGQMRSTLSSSSNLATASTLDLVDGLGKTLDIGGCDTGNGDSAILGGVNGVL